MSFYDLQVFTFKSFTHFPLLKCKNEYFFSFKYLFLRLFIKKLFAETTMNQGFYLTMFTEVKNVDDFTVMLYKEEEEYSQMTDALARDYGKTLKMYIFFYIFKCSILIK